MAGAGETTLVTAVAQRLERPMAWMIDELGRLREGAGAWDAVEALLASGASRH